MPQKSDTQAEEHLGSFTGWASSGVKPSERSVVAWDHNERTGVMTAFSFSMTARGVADLVGFSVEFVEDRDAAERIASETAERAARHRPPKGLTSRQIRSAIDHRGKLAEARRHLILRQGVGATMNLPMSGQLEHRFDPGSKLFYAALAVEYEALINTPEQGSARRRMAARHRVTESRVKNWMTDAKAAGMWATSGRGSRGAATTDARKLLAQQEATK